MAAEDKYIKEISKYNQHGLFKLWKEHLDNSLDATQNEFWRDGKLMEYVVLRAFELEGAIIRWPYSIWMDGIQLEQIDGAITIGNQILLIESKDKDRGLNIEPIAKMRNQLLRRPSSVIGCVFSRNGYSEPAMALSRYMAPQTILLWDGNELCFCIEHKMMIDALNLKIHKAAEEFDFCYNVYTYYQLQQLGSL